MICLADMPYLQITCCLLVFYILSFLEGLIVPLFMWLLSPILMLTLSWHLSQYLKETFVHPLMKQVECAKKVVLITGCDSGFGLNTARALASHGFTVFAACYDEANCILKRHPVDRVKVIGLDVTSVQSVRNAYETVEQFLRENASMRLHALINNAGVLSLGLTEWDSVDDISYFTKHMQVNCWGQVRMVKRFLPLLRAAAPGSRVININSMAARTTALPITGYAVSKAAAAAFSESLHLELSPFRIHTISVEPWIAETSLSSGDHMAADAAQSLERTSPDTRNAYSARSMSYVHAWLTNAKNSPLNVTVDLVVARIVEAVLSPDPEPVMRVSQPIFSVFFTLANDILPWRLVVLLRHWVTLSMQKLA